MSASLPAVTFLSFFLGLVQGDQTVRVAAGPGVAAVDISMDDHPVCHLEAEPWSCRVDFGPGLAPHRLTAVAVDEDGAELGRDRQLVNLPRPRVEAALVLSPAVEGERRGSLSWRSVDHGQAQRIRLALDGRPFQVEDPADFALPPHQPEAVHVLTAEVALADGLRAQTEVAFGGWLGSATSTELTALPLVLDPGASAPLREHLQGLLWRGSRLLRVAGVDAVPGRLMVVRSREAVGELKRLGAVEEATQPWRQEVRRALRALRSPQAHLALAEHPHLEMVFPHPGPGGEDRVGLFPVAPAVPLVGREIGWLLPRLEEADRGRGDQRLADAVAVAGVRAAAGDRPRAVVLILDGDDEDASGLDPGNARAYLEAIRVPLFVWTVGEGGDPRWGPVRHLHDVEELERAAGQVLDHLERQRIVWVEGSWLPGEARLAPGSEPVELVAGSPPPPMPTRASATTRMPPEDLAEPPRLPTTDVDRTVEKTGLAFTGRVDVTTVEIELVASRDGEPVEDLRAEELRIFEDGELRPVTNFTRIVGGRPDDGLGSAAGDPESRSVLLLFDLTGGDRRWIQRLCRLAAEQVQREADSGLRWAVVAAGNRAHILQPFTADADEVVAALRRVPEVAVSPELFGGDDGLASPAPAGPGRRESVDDGSSGAAAALLDAAGRLVRDARDRQRLARLATLAAATADVFEATATDPGRKVCLLFSTAVRNSEDDLAAHLGDPAAPEARGDKGAESRRAAEVEAAIGALLDGLVRLANTAGYTVSTVTDLPPERLGFSSAVVAGRDLQHESVAIRRYGVSDPASGTWLQETLAQGTGGRVAASTRPEEALAELHQEISSYYSVGFQTRAGDVAGYRTLRLEVDRPGVDLRFQRGHHPLALEEALVHRLAASLELQRSGGDLPVRLRVRRTAAGAVEVGASLPLASLALLPGPELAEGELTAALAVYDSRGRPLDLRRRRFPLQVPLDLWRNPGDLPVTVGFRFDLPDEPVRALALGVYDRVGQLWGVQVAAVPEMR